MARNFAPCLERRERRRRMSKKFRIIRVETTNGQGESSYYFKIQKRLLFWFFDYGIKSHYHTYTDWNAHHKNMPVHMAMITKRIFIFNDKERASEFLKKIENPFVEYYKGNKIVRVFNDDTWADIYINKSYFGVWKAGVGYEHSGCLNQLKEMIDKRTKKVTVTVLNNNQ